MVHLEHRTAAWEVLELLEADGVPASRVVLAHIDRNLDAGLHTELAAAGAYLGYDGVARHREAPDSAIIDILARVVADGGGERVLLGGDVPPPSGRRWSRRSCGPTRAACWRSTRRAPDRTPGR